MGSLYPTLSLQVICCVSELVLKTASQWLEIFRMGVLHSIPLCSRGNGANQVGPLDLDKNNNEASVVYTSQPHAIVASVPVPPPEATSTPRPQSPTGLENEQYSDSSQMASEAEDDSEAAVEEPPALSDSGLEESATEFEFSRPSPPTVTVEDTDHNDDGLEVGEADQSGGQETGLDEGVHESDETFDDTLVIDGHEEIDLNDDDPLERPPEPTVPDERVSSDEEGQPQEQPQLKDETTRKISSLLSELVGDRPAGEAMRPDLVPMR